MDSKETQMNLYSYLEKHGELENATAALEYFAEKKGFCFWNQFQRNPNNIFKSFKVVTNDTTTRVGQYHPRKKQIELHIGLLVDGREEEHRQTLLHEVAHLIQRHIWSGTKSHGREWKMVMGRLGIPADRCHSSDWMKEHTAKKAKLIYACKKCELEIPAQKPRKKLLQMGITHRNCGGTFYLKKDKRAGQRVPVRRVPGPGLAKLQKVAATFAAPQGTTKPVLGRVLIKKAMYRNKWVRPGIYDVVREFKYKKNNFFKGTISILVGTEVYRVTVSDNPDWFVR